MAPSLNAALEHYESGRINDSEQACRAIIGERPDSHEAHHLLALTCFQMRRAEEAIAALREAIRLHGTNPQYHRNLGKIFIDLDRPADAVDTLQRARALGDSGVDLIEALAHALLACGEADKAVEEVLTALAAVPNSHILQQSLIECARQAKALPDRDEARAQWIACIASPNVHAQKVFGLTLGMLETELVALLQLAKDGDDVVMGQALAHGHEAFESPLLLTLLSSLRVVDAGLELFLTRWRRAALLALGNGGAPTSLSFVAALAQQACCNDYAFFAAPDETAALADLIDRIDWAAPIDQRRAYELSIIAAYQPLHTLPGAAGLAALTPDDVPDRFFPVVTRAYVEPLAVQQGAADIPTLALSDDPTSGVVRAQYEASPYPRWRAIFVPTERSLADMLHGVIPGFRAPPTFTGPAEVLVAGCGTGHSACYYAGQLPDCQITAIDLSRSSLAYAARKAGERRLTNLSFAQADILTLGDAMSDRRFEMIESSGVLHHMADPLSAWRILRHLLKPDGVMRISLYSQSARVIINAARDLVAKHGLSTEPDSIRAFRDMILRLPDEHPLGRLVGFTDFFGLSECRDLLYHVQEVQFTVPDLIHCLASLDLEFLGFQGLGDDYVAAYQDMFPGDPEQRDLVCWEKFEAQCPDCFSGMYQFWCQAKS